MLAKKELSDEHWTSKRDEVKAEHLMERAPEDLGVGWKAWIKDNGSGKEGPGAAGPSYWNHLVGPQMTWCWPMTDFFPFSDFFVFRRLKTPKP